MHKNACWMVMAALALIAGTASAQTAATKAGPKTTVAITFDTERAKQTQSTCSCFWLNGAGMDISRRVYKKLELAGEVSGMHAGNIQPGVGLSKISLMGGPRYRVAKFTKLHGAELYGESLFGFAHGFDGLFPNAANVKPRANAFTLEVGAGLDVPLRHGFYARVPEIDYVFTDFPNSGANAQHDLRIKAGLAFKF